MPEVRSPQEPVASGIHSWLESGAVIRERMQGGRDNVHITTDKDKARRMVRTGGVKHKTLEQTVTEAIKILNSLVY